MKLPAPKLPPYDIAEWQRLPFAERLKKACQAWAIDGYGTPVSVYAFYLLKVGLYVGVWLLFCSMSKGLGGPGAIGHWWSSPEALKKAVLWSMAFEGLGLGCGSGPLTGRYVPPFAAALHFARPGTVRLPLFPQVPLLGGNARTYLDAGLYITHLVFLFRALAAPEITISMLIPVAVILPVLALRDKTIFLASRGEHYYSVLLCMLAPAAFVAGAKSVWLAIWFWAATSKLNLHFPSVVCVMTSNSPVLSFPWLRKRMYQGFPDDLRPSALAKWMAHGGTIVEYIFPLLLAMGTGGPLTRVGLVVMLVFHLYITSNVPMAVPIEWNVIMVYGAFVLFGGHAEVRAWELGSLPLAVYLAVALLVLPLAGNLFPRFLSFLVSMRYYAGNWAYGVWLFKGDSAKKLDRGIVKIAPAVDDQLKLFYDHLTIVAVLSKLPAFRAMHLHGRALREILPRAVDDIEAYTWLDGEVVAGLVLGWNFGDGHLHDEALIRAVQERCHFEPSELRCILVEAQPLGKPDLAWRIVDAHDGERERGRIAVRGLTDKQPWPDLPEKNAA